jgi:hypothetical protein
MTDRVDFVSRCHPVAFPSLLIRGSWALEASLGDQLVVVALFTVTPAPGILEMHICADPGWHGRWYSRRFIHLIFDIFGFSGCSAVVVQSDSHPRAVQIVQRAKAVHIEPFYIFTRDLHYEQSS